MSFDASNYSCNPAPTRLGGGPAGGSPQLLASRVLKVREQLADSLRDQLISQSVPSGMILLGGTGTGKTSMMRALVDRLRATTCLIHLRGSTHAEQQPYGALRVLLADLPEDLLDHPAKVINGLTRALKDRAHDLPVIVTVDDANHLDGSSITALGQLVQAGTVRLVAACTDLPGAPQYFQTLCRKGILVRVDMPDLTQQHVADYLLAALGLPVSRASSLALHRQSAGNARLLSALLDDYLATGALRCVGGVWVLAADEVNLGANATHLVTDRIRTLLPSQRQLLGTLAVAGETPLAVVPADNLGDLDDLQELGVLSIDSDRWASVSVIGPLLSDVILGRASRVDLWEPGQPGQRIAVDSSASSGTSGGKFNAERSLERAREAAFKGEYRRAIHELKSPEFELGALEPEARQRATVLLCEALAFTGQADDAKEAANSLQLSRFEGKELPTRIAITLAVLEASVGNVAAMLEVSAHLRNRSCGTGTYEELAEGIILAAGGRLVEAESLLLPALRQLQIHDPAGVAPLAAAVLAWISTADAPERAEQYLSMSMAESIASPWIVRRLTKHFAALALQGTASADRAAFELRALSSQDEELGNSSWQLVSLCNAMRQGDHGVAQLILKLSPTCQGQYASLCQLYAKGVDAEDAELLLHAMDTAQALDDRFLARDMAVSAVQLATQSGDQVTRGYVAERVRGVVVLTGTVLGARRQLASLTGREAEVVSAVVDGRSNRDVALALGLSVRTVEGHLHRVYTKLHVRTKAELLAKVALSAGAT
ncbi:LuxR C-terminal-related transcriptional regulator [Arthrobacter sp. H20]|uniref:LuxR C-terminal-related transcriptional regulator n=1 Tax=Arthrobacter sp. H20 TaxID=1267981 RepID=UPI00047A7AF3|nr:LuxR C-terminal-related transcriptional regulator [Arthrobacter sp. H20]